MGNGSRCRSLRATAWIAGCAWIGCADRDRSNTTVGAHREHSRDLGSYRQGRRAPASVPGRATSARRGRRRKRANRIRAPSAELAALTTRLWVSESQNSESTRRHPPAGAWTGTARTTTVRVRAPVGHREQSPTLLAGRRPISSYGTMVRPPPGPRSGFWYVWLQCICARTPVNAARSALRKCPSPKRGDGTPNRRAGAAGRRPPDARTSLRGRPRG